MKLYYETELYHHGIKGMKWGKRRFQNSDGSLTAAGRSRYGGSAVGARVKAAGYKLAAKNYELNEKTYNKMGGKSAKTMASMNKAAKNDMYKKSAQYQKQADQIKAQKQADKQAKQAERNTPEAQAERRKKALKVGAAVAGTALAAYGTYKVAQYVQNNRSNAAMQKAQDYIDKNAYRKIGQGWHTDGTQHMVFESGDGSGLLTVKGQRNKIGKEIGKHNAKVVAEGRQMYRDATNTRLDRGLGKIVGAGDRVGDATKRAGNAVGKATQPARNAVGDATKSARTSAANTARKAKNSVLDVVNPIYETVPGKTTTSVRKIGNMDVTETVTEYYQKKKKRQ